MHNGNRVTLLLPLILVVGLAWPAMALDLGTGIDPTGSGSTHPWDLDGPRPAPELIGYTTDALVLHYQSLDHSAMSTARNDLLAQGHSLVPVNSLNPGDLAGLDRLIVGVVYPGYTLSSTQMDVVEDFVLAGGCLVFLGENNNYFRDNNVVVGGRFSITYPAVGGDPPETILSLVGAHPIMQGPFGNVAIVDGSNNASGFYGSMESPGPDGTSILDFPGGASACVVIEPSALAPGSGTVLAVAEINVWDNAQILSADNRVFWNNIFTYCPEGPTPIQHTRWGTIKSTFR